MEVPTSLSVETPKMLRRLFPLPRRERVRVRGLADGLAPAITEASRTGIPSGFSRREEVGEAPTGE